MSLRDEVLRALHGHKTDRVLFTCYKGLLPAGAESIDAMALVASAPGFRAETPEVSYSSRDLGPGVRETTMHTPWGELTKIAHTETGYGSSWTREHWVKSPEDYAILEKVVRHTQIVIDPEPLRELLAEFGDRGVALAWMNRTPFQRLWIEYTGMERLACDLVDYPQAVEAVLEAFFDQSREVLRVTAQCPAQLVWVPDNITGEMTGPPIFRKYLLPYYREVCDVLLPAGKLPCCHMDGMLRQIADCIAQTDLPVIEAFTPPPDGNFPVREARERWPGKSLWLNFPSSVHLCSTEEITRVTRDLVEQAGGTAGFVIGVTENIPASVGSRSLEAIAAALA
jgi:hypothetical protein